MILFCLTEGIAIKPENYLTINPGGGGGDSTNFYTGRLCPEVQPLTLLYTIFHEKEPLSYSFYWQMVPLSHTLFRTLHPF